MCGVVIQEAGLPGGLLVAKRTGGLLPAGILKPSWRHSERNGLLLPIR